MLPRIVLPEGDDERIRAAARRLSDEGRVLPLVLRPPASAAGPVRQWDLDERHTVDPADSGRLARYATAYAALRPNPNPAVAARLMRKPLYFAGMMVQSGDADALLAGVSVPTARVIEAGMLTVGLAPGIRSASSFFLMIVPLFEGQADHEIIFADCAVNVSPDAQTLADIALASAASAERLLPHPPRVAMLSFSTHGSASHESIDRIREALALVRARAPSLLIDGELQADAALIARVAAKKIRQASAVAGQANVLVFPDLNSGNIAYKLTQYLAGARALGPVLQGFAKPVSDLSRGASVDDIVATAYLLARTIQPRSPIGT